MDADTEVAGNGPSERMSISFFVAILFPVVTLPDHCPFYSVPLVPEQAQGKHDRDDVNASSRFNLPSLRVEGPSPDKSEPWQDGVAGSSESRPVSPICFSSFQSNPGLDFDFDGDMDMSPRCRCQLAEMGVRDQAGGKRRGGVRDRVGAGRGGSREYTFDGALSLVGVNARGRVCDAHWTRDRVVVDEEKKHKRDDPAAVPRYQRGESETEDRDRVRTGMRQRAWRKWGQFCRERICKKFFTWSDHAVGGGVASSDGLDCGAERSGSGSGPGSGSSQGAGVGGLTLGRTSPQVGATGTEPVKTVTTTGNSAETGPELSRQARLAKTRPRPMSASAWLTGPISTSTPNHTRSSGRLVKQRPRSIATASQLDKVTVSFGA
ncbi:hypothetical protein OG21DRAFT_957776 [Imleria badia]|nr:hypothetical protein OG21DRAFT_957776 [Imleria badia]